MASADAAKPVDPPADDTMDADPAPAAGEEEEEEATPQKQPEKKRGGRRKKGEAATAEKKTPPSKKSAGPAVKRPSRESYAELAPRATPAKKSPIVQGSGTKLKDIPNVSFKLSKRKADENLQSLHTVLHGRKSTRMEDRQWMYTGRRSMSDFSMKWVSKPDAFLERAFSKAAKFPFLVLCPCSKCENKRYKNKETMGKHLLKNGFTPDYTRWVHHGEAYCMREEVVGPCVEVYDADLGRHTGLVVPPGLFAPPSPPFAATPPQ